MENMEAEEYGKEENETQQDNEINQLSKELNKMFVEYPSFDVIKKSLLSLFVPKN